MKLSLRMTAMTLLAGMVIGCNSDSDGKEKKAAEARLIGNWRGTFVLDDDALKKVVDTKGKTAEQISKRMEFVRKQGGKFVMTWAVRKGRVEVAGLNSGIGDMKDLNWKVLEADGDVITIRMEDPNSKKFTDEYKLTFTGSDSFLAEVTTRKMPFPPIKFERTKDAGTPKKSE